MQFKQQIINNLQVSPSNQTKKGEPIGSPFQKKSFLKVSPNDTFEMRRSHTLELNIRQTRMGYS
jgi:hypothetical protein